MLDEATSALDNKTERSIIKSIRSVGVERTLIMIAHRLSTVRECDRLYVMKNGEIVAVGEVRHPVARFPGVSRDRPGQVACRDSGDFKILYFDSWG